jgi:hypothetical protein
MDELIRKKDALDALMAERKHLLDKGRWGAEHVLTHHGYNVIDELPPVQSDVPDIYDGELISRQAATTIPAMPKEHRHYQTNNLDDAYEQGWADLQECIENLPPVQPKRMKGRWLPDNNFAYEMRFVCSVCKESEVVPTIGFTKYKPIWDFCPNCGADMRGNEDGTD